MKKKQVGIMVLIIVAALLIGGAAGYAIGNIQKSMPTSSSSKTDIKSFQECADAGNPVLLTYPETCTVPRGETFTNN